MLFNSRQLQIYDAFRFDRCFVVDSASDRRQTRLVIAQEPAMCSANHAS